ncbi:hypothetical protein QJS04_geneDACA007295 [Acorus gramineus]|uniref:Cell cycle checkpoint control protein RAD9A n=1 Tax=Acorus gramineus TaxID=55184 RepID=A0AAV9BNN4_ACOGR|nr:hypothetical protein QJS04_geneDACA007295 [Acorus gramineus]
MKPDAFDVYTLSSPQVQCSVFSKAVCSVLRTPAPSVDRVQMLLSDSGASKMQWTLECHNGMKKTYWISCNVEPDIQHLSLDRRKFPSNFVVRPRDLNRLLANFQSSLQEITVIATETMPLSSDVGGSIGGKAVELRSYIDPTKDNSDTSLHTQLWIDPSEEFLQYRHIGNPVDVTFSMKELKAFISFCEACEAEIQLFFEKAGEPILMALKFGLDDNSSSDFDATLVLATMLTSQLCEGSMPGQQPSAAPGSCDQNNLGRDPQSQHVGGGATAPNTVHNSEHTKIWSELSGSAAKSSASAEVRQAQVGGNPNSNIQNGMERFHMMDNSTTLPEREHMAKINMPPVENDDLDELQDRAGFHGNGWSQHHPSNWLGEGDGEDEEDESDLCVQSTP